jgi:uncharacterized protein (TIGR03437 family)
LKSHFSCAAVLCLSLCGWAQAQNTVIATAAGGGTAGLGDGGPATAATLNQPGGVFLDSSGNLFIADTLNNRIRKVSGGTITTVVGTGGLPVSPALNQPSAIFVDSAGDIFIADTVNNMIREVSAAGTATIIAGGGLGGFFGDGGAANQAVLFNPQGLYVDSSGNIYIADTLNNAVRKVTASTGIITAFAGNEIGGFSGDGGKATSAQLYSPTGVTMDNAGNLLIADKFNNRIRSVSPGGNITTIAGNGTAGFSGDNGLATAAALYNPTGVFVDASGNIFVTVYYSNRIRKIAPGGIITTVAGGGAQSFSGDGGPAASGSLNHPSTVAVDGSGNIFIADTGNNRIREVSASTGTGPSINPSGVVPIYSSVPVIQPGEWVTIYGSNLVPTTTDWSARFPAPIPGITVTIDGNPAYIYYASPGLIDVQAPDDTSTGTVPVVVTSANGKVTSTVTLAQAAPSFFVLGDSKHVAAIIARANGAFDYAGPTGSSLGFPTVAAKAGDVVELYATGLGPVTQEVDAGQPVPAGGVLIANPVTVLINNVAVTPLFAGIVSPGQFQINVVIPAGLGTGDVSIVASVGGVQTQANIVLAVQ